MMAKDRQSSRKARGKRVRYKVKQVRRDRPRLSVFRSSTNIYAQIIDDAAGVTLVSASTLEKDIKDTIKCGGNCDAATAVGKSIAKKALEKKIGKVIFDRGGFLYHGRVKVLAEAARESGLQF
ncbi:MAG: 50S ribosomal protein L18 [Magnetococcales bacterium]|nr:50S ribosomal protein L18 [Magnetococcales bacterium]